MLWYRYIILILINSYSLFKDELEKKIKKYLLKFKISNLEKKKRKFGVWRHTTSFALSMQASFKIPIFSAKKIPILIFFFFFWSGPIFKSNCKQIGLYGLVSGYGHTKFVLWWGRLDLGRTNHSHLYCY